MLIEESGYLLQPLVRRSWAPRGETPIHYSWERHGRWSVIAGITVSPVRQRLGLYFRLYCRNIPFEQVKEFVTVLHRHLGRKFLLVLDRHSAHRKAARLLREEHLDWLEVEW